MAKKSMLEQARKAYNKSASTKYRVQANGKRTKKKKEKVKSHYGSIQKKTQNTEENRREARNQTKNVVSKVGSNVVKKKTTESKPTTTGTNKQNGRRSGAITSVSSKSAERRTGAATARTTAKNVGNVVKTSTNLHKTPLKVTDVTQGTAKGTAAGTAYNKSKATDKALQKAGEKKTLTVSREQLNAEQKAAQERAARQTRFYTNSLVAAGRMTQKQADDAVEKARKNAKKGVKEDHTLTYSNSAQSNETVQRVANASKFTNVEVEDKKAAEKAMREARFYANSQVAAGKMTQKEADRLVKQAGKGHRTTQSANILDKLGGEGEAERQGTRQAGQLNDSKFASGVMQGLSYADNTRAVGKYNKQAAELVDTVKQSGAFNTGYMVGQAGQFMLGGTGKMTDALVKGVAKSGAARSALNIGLRKAGADALFESPINALDAVKMSTDANGNFDKNAFVKYMALNTGLSGGMGGVIGGVGSKLAKNDAKAYITLSAKANSGAGLTEQEKVRLVNLQKKMDSIRNGNDVANTDIVNKADYDAEVSKKVFENGGTVDDAIKVVNGGGTHTEKIGYANSIKETANAEFERLRVAREQMLEQARNTTPEEAKLLRAQASKLSSEINRLGEISNTAEKQLSIELKRNRKAVAELADNVKSMSDATGVNYRVVDDKQMRKLIKDAGGDVSDDYFYKGFYYKNKDGQTEILINGDSPQAHQTVIGHETGHLIKDSNEKEFDELGDMLEEYAKKQDDFDAVYNQLKRSYPDATEAELREEVTCELLGKYVYGADNKFIKQLAGEKPSVVQRIVEYLKRLFDNTSDKEMAKELKAIIDKTNGLIKGIDDANAGKAKFSIVKKVKADDGAEYENVVKLDAKSFDDISDKQKKIRADKFYDFVYDELAGRNFTAYDNNGKKVDIEFARADETHKKDGAKYRQKTLDEIASKTSYKKRSKETQVAVQQADELIEVSKQNRMASNNKHGDLDANGWEYRKLTVMSQNGNLFDCVLNIAKTKDGRNLLYDVEITKKIGRASRTPDGGSPTANLSKQSISPSDTSVNGKYSKENVGYHAGDLGKAESMGNQTGGRGTGHFGTGTYFVGNKVKIDGYNARDGKPAPVETVNFDKYNLYKPHNTEEAYALHDFLRDVNDYFELVDSPKTERNFVRNIKRRTDDLDYKLWDAQDELESLNKSVKSMDDDSLLAAEVAEQRVYELREELYELGKDALGESRVGKLIGEEDPKQLSEKSANEILWDLQHPDDNGWYNNWERPLAKVSSFYDGLDLWAIRLNTSKDKLLDAMREAKKQSDSLPLGSDKRYTADSASTILMKKLGYEGVDVRHTDLDNTTYGSVIYDLKGEDLARKKEIGTAKFSKESKPKTETPTDSKPKTEKTETQKLSDNNNASAELKQALVDIDKAGVYKDDAEKVSKRFNDLESKIKKEVAHLENAKKSDKYATEAERAERVAEIEDELKTLRNQQAKAAGEIEQMGKMKAVDNSKTAKEQIRELHGDRSVNKELKNADNLKNEDSWIKDKWNSVRRLWEDSLIDVENVAKKTGGELREQILTAANRVRNSMNVANNWITHTRKSFDNKVGGKALDDIFTKELIQNEAKYNDFQEYLIMKHVPARHAKGTDIYADISPELAEKRVKELEEEYKNKDQLKEADELEARLDEMSPEEKAKAEEKIKDLRRSEVEKWAEDVYDYLKDLQQYRVDSGLLSKEAADQFAKDYPFYVPTNRVNDETVDFFTGGTSNGIRTAKGGESEVLDLYSQIYTATNKTIHAAEENQMLNLYFKAKGLTDAQIKDAELSDLEHAVIDAQVNKKTGAATVSFFVDGKPVKLPCSHQLALGLRELDGLEFERLMKAAKVATLYGKPFKALITDWNLVFGVRNGMRDLQQAVVNSKDTKYFGSSMGAAAHAIADNNSPYRKAYASMGGEQAQLVSYDAVAERMGLEKGKVDVIHEKVDEWVDASVNVKGKEVNTNPIHYIEGINGAIEMMPRMCEFIGTLRKQANATLKKQGSSLKKLRSEIVDEVKALEKEGKVGASEVGAEVENRLAERVLEITGKDGLDSAMRNANDITLNFGRNGVLGKALNMGFVPYLNPSIQGLSKLVRLFTEAGQEGGWKALASIGMKLGTFTIAPAVWNELALRNNEDFQNINTRDKDNNFFIALGDGKFIKIPKPRENAVLAEPVEYGLRYFLDKSEYAFFDWDKLKTEDVPLWEKIPLTDEGKQSLRTAVDNIGVINPMTSNMVSPLWQTFHNKTWYGGSIESAYETSINEDTGKANVPVNERYDTGTSGVAIWLGQSKVAKELNLSPKKIDNILDSYTGMIYDLGISQTTEEAKTRGNYLLRTAASQFLKDSVFSNKLSTKAWEKIDGMSKKEQDEYKSKYMYDTYKYDDAMDAITADKDMTVKEKMDAKRQLQMQRNKLYRAAINGEPNETNPLKDISKYLGANKTLNKFLPKSGDEKYDNWTDYYKNYKKTKGYKGLTPAQKEKEAQKFLDVYTLGVKGQSKVSGDFHDSPSWGMTGVAAAQRYKQGKLSQKDAKTIMESCGVYESQTESYFKYADHGGNVSRYAVTKKNNNKAEDLAESMGVTTSGDGSIWKNKYSKEKGIKGGVLSMSLATGKADFKDRAYYISNSGDSNMLIKMNAARGYAEKYGHTTKQIIKLGKKADSDGNTYLSNDEIESACQTIKKGKATSEEKAMAWVLLGGNPNKNPFGAIGDYSHDGDTGITMDGEEKSGGRGGHGWGRRRHRGGGGGGGSSKGTVPKTASGAIKGTVTDPFSGISRIGGRSGGSASTNTRKSNLNDAYRKRVKKLRQNLS